MGLLVLPLLPLRFRIRPLNVWSGSASLRRLLFFIATVGGDMLDDGDDCRWCFLWCSRYRDPLLRSWPRDGEEARRGECEPCRRLLRRPRSSASFSASASIMAILGDVSSSSLEHHGAAAPGGSEATIDIEDMIASFDSAVGEGGVESKQKDIASRHKVWSA
jgi:hypothetical protein